jgi:hypothetical protein
MKLKLKAASGYAKQRVEKYGVLGRRMTLDRLSKPAMLETIPFL